MTRRKSVHSLMHLVGRTPLLGWRLFGRMLHIAEILLRQGRHLTALACCGSGEAICRHASVLTVLLDRRPTFSDALTRSVLWEGTSQHPYW